MFRYEVLKLRATIQWVALFLFLKAPFAMAKPPVPPAKAPDFKDVLAQAQELLLNKKRNEALQKLQQLRAQNSLKPTEREELNEATKEIATRFLTDKGQRSYELGLSRLPAQAATALTHLRAAELLEDGNAQIQEAVVRALLANEDCKTAAKEAAVLQSLSAVFSQLQELQMQIAWCLDDAAEVESLLKRKAAENRLTPHLQKLAAAWLKWRQKDPERAVTLLREVVATDPKNPAALYWLWRVQKEQDLDAQAAAAAFTKRCRLYEVEFRRRTSPMIEMCLHFNEVEAYLKAKGAEGADAG
ncbi:MAG: tetratricopeptide repeat protein [Bdellovibrionales bacterium]